MTPVWNLLWDFRVSRPRSTARWRSPAAAHASRATDHGHAHPAGSLCPNFDQAEARAATPVEPLPAYRYIYPFQPQVVANLAYYFSYSYRAPQEVESYTRAVEEQVHAWRVAFG